ncbi:RNA polymerase I-specific transcription initiation factor RRN3 [Pyrus ussuriensis x Pyrus communis]|uniref:RNA polymerase I-specific transcription initiation factor RRN3 n=1 Tax=Pyrus ussuriensis x Pyrus communis TaxID=2448454 RepID=A0A5N5GRN5_9ROSA|nr:RNA polymerase I-specific transcription initiation factor RRN3 [Pyrus ussuriensis x Pyrus communis]
MGVELRNNEAALDEMAEDGDFTDSDLVDHIRDILCSVTSGSPAALAENKDYERLISVVSHDGGHGADEEAFLVTTLEAPSRAVSCIDHDLHNLLLSAIFRMNLWTYRPQVMDAVIHFIVSLASSNGMFVDECLAMLTKQFFPPRSFQLPRGLTRKGQVLSRVHSTLNDIADVLPLSPARLVPIVLAATPQYRFHDINTLSVVMYVENMLKLESGALGEVVRIPMLAGMVELLLDLDIGWDDIEDDSSKGIFEMELEAVDKSTDDDLNDGSEITRKLSTKISGSNSFAEKLDSLLVLTFEHLESCEVGGRLIEVFETLLESFKRTVLTAYKSKFAQVIYTKLDIYEACQLTHMQSLPMFREMMENLGGYYVMFDTFFMVLISVLGLCRMSAVSYLASYLSRAKFLSASVIASTLERLVDWCSKYVKMQNDKVNPEAHRVFYSGCQAIMYLLCFRMRSMMDVPLLKSWLLRLPLESVLNNKLSPLEFLRQSKAAGLFMTLEKFEFNDFLESELSKEFGGRERLDMFFPFDPCLLKKSDRYIRPKFIFWSMVHPTYDIDEDSCDEDIGESVANENVDGMDYAILQQHYDLDEFDSALNKMSITPKNSLHSTFGGAVNKPMRMPSRIRPSTSPESL